MLKRYKEYFMFNKWAMHYKVIVTLQVMALEKYIPTTQVYEGLPLIPILLL